MQMWVQILAVMTQKHRTGHTQVVYVCSGETVAHRKDKKQVFF